MTLGIVLLAKDHTVVIASDKRVTGGTSSMTAHSDVVEKIYRISDKCGMTIAGEPGAAKAIIDIFLKEIEVEIIRKKSQELAVSDAAEIFRKVAVDSYTKWFKDMSMEDWVRNVKSDVIPFFRLLMVGFDKSDSGKLDECKIIELSSLRRFAPNNITTYFGVIGVTTIAQYLLYRFYSKNQDEMSSAGFAGFCIQETSSQDDSVGDEFQLASFSVDKPFQFYKDSELDKIKKRSAELKTEFQIALFSKPKVREKG